MAWYQSTAREITWPAFGKAHQVGCLQGWEGCPKASSQYMECFIKYCISDMGVYTVTPDRCTILCCRVHKGHPHPASRLMKVMLEVIFPCSDSRCRWYISDLSIFTPRCVGIWVKNSHFLSSVTLSLRTASLFRWKAADVDLSKWASVAKSGNVLLVPLGIG